MIFADSRWLWGLVAVPLLLALEWRAARRAEAALRRLVGPREEHALLAQRRPGQRRLGALLRLGALALLVLGAAQPEWGREVVRRGATGSDVVLVLDVSASMDARDVPPSRIDEARREALAVVDRLEGSRVGVVAFAGDAVRLSPLTLDRGAVRLTLESLSSGSVSEPGTDLGKALRRAVQLMPAGRREEQVIVAWTDGEDLERGARAAFEELSRTGIRVFAVGVGTATGDVIPVLDDQGRAVDVKRDESGGTVRSRLDEGLLRTLARRTRGGYFAALRPGGELPRLLAALGTLARSGRGERLVERPVARFPLCGLLVAALLLAEATRPRRRLARARAEERTALHSERGVAAAVLITCALAAPAHGQSAWARGDQAFRAGRWAEAESLYALRLRSGGPPDLKLNLATARANGGRTDEAELELRRLAAAGDRVGLAAGYNLGTVLGQRRAWDEALGELRRSLERDPTDRDARWNYEVVLRRREQSHRAKDRPPEPRRGPGAPQRGGGGPPASAIPPQSAGSPSASGAPPGSSAAGSGMSRSQAEQLLDALAAQARSGLQGQRQTPVMREKRGKDW